MRKLKKTIMMKNLKYLKNFSNEMEDKVKSIIVEELGELNEKIQKGLPLTREEEIKKETIVNRAYFQVRGETIRNEIEKDIKNQPNSIEKNGKRYVKHPVTGQLLDTDHYEIVKRP